MDLDEAELEERERALQNKKQKTASQDDASAAASYYPASAGGLSAAAPAAAPSMTSNLVKLNVGGKEFQVRRPPPRPADLTAPHRPAPPRLHPRPQPQPTYVRHPNIAADTID